MDMPVHLRFRQELYIYCNFSPFECKYIRLLKCLLPSLDAPHLLNLHTYISPVRIQVLVKPFPSTRDTHPAKW